MKKRDILSLVYQLAAPVGLILVGAVLVLAPDVLTALISRFLGWGILLIGIGFAVAAIVSRQGMAGKLIWAMAAFAMGSFLVRNPLFMARQVGLFLGLMLLARGSREVRLASGHSKPLGIAMIVVGVVLILSPLTATRLVFSLCGVVIVIVGIVMLLDKMKERRYLDSGDSNIIDAL